MALDVTDWAICANLDMTIEQGLLHQVRQSGLTINQNSGAYLANETFIHPWTGGVMWLDWAIANIQETPLLIEKYYRDLKKDFVWWSDIRHEPLGFEQQLRWMGLRPLKTMVGLCFDMADYRMHESSDKFGIYMVEEPVARKDFFHVFEKAFDYSPEFKQSVFEFMKSYIFQDRVLYKTGYYRGHPVSIGSFACAADHMSICSLATNPKHRKNGFGTLMLEDLLAHAYFHKLRQVTTFVPEDVASFFVARGFEPKVKFNVYATEKVFQRWSTPKDFFSIL